jgi:type IV secretory pathway TraG/TraD family ATPase VirD4
LIGAGYAERCKSGFGGGFAETAGEIQYGAAKSTSYLMQCRSKDYPVSFVVTDPKGTLVIETGKMLRRHGYKIKVLNTVNFSKSMKYNPFVYARHEVA